MSRLTIALLALTTLCFQLCHALNTIDFRGQQFVDSSTGDRFMVVGVDYQPGGQGGYKPQDGEDPLSNGTVCLRDAAMLQKLGVNTIRVYNVAPEINHDACASVFNLAGIYMIIDVNAPFSGESLDRDNPGPSYTAEYLTRTFSVVEAFKNYPNTLAFFAGNEVINDVKSAKSNPPYIRAIQRDIKRYIKNNCDRQFPVGYSAADVRDILEDTYNYFACAINGDASGDTSRSDFFGLNSYSWCGDVNTFQTSGYDVIAAMFQDSPIPVIFSEYGCNEVKPRTFPEVPSLYGKQMSMLSGGLVYEYSEEPSQYGLVTINDNGTVSLRVDYTNLQDKYNKIDLKLLQATNSSAQKIQPPKCSSSLIKEAGFSKSFNIPNTPSNAESIINNGVRNAPVGKIIDIKSLNVPVAVYAVDGSEIQGLSINKVSNTNTPQGQSINGSTTSSSTDSSRGDSAAFMLQPQAMLIASGALLAGFMALWS